MERLCLDCGTLIRGRADKKFCNDSCRSNYNNLLRLTDDHFLKQVNQILKSNRKILKDRNPDGKTTVKLSTLVKKGFDLDYHTHSYATGNGRICFFCYEYGYLALEDGEVLLVKMEEK
jgi:hypothetical protein